MAPRYLAWILIGVASLPVVPPSAKATRLKPWASYAVRKKIVTDRDLRFSFRNRIDVKFREGSGVRSRQGRLVVDDPTADGHSATELAVVNQILDGTAPNVAVRMHYLPEGRLTEMKLRGEERTRSQVPDLNLWFYVYLDLSSKKRLAATINQLNALDVVELASGSTLPVYPGLGLRSPSTRRPTVVRPSPDATLFMRLQKKHDRLPLPSRSDI